MTAQDLKNSILQLAVQGKLVPQDPSDEPASELLTRVYAEKSTLVKEGKLKKEKALPPITEDEIPFDIPGTWKWVRLNDIASITSGGTPSRAVSDYWNGGIPWVKISDISGKYVNYTEEQISQSGLDNSSAKVFPKGTLLYTIFATIGTVGILNIDAATNQAIAGVTFYGEYNINYMYYVAVGLKDLLVSKGKGMAQMNINQTILKSTPIPIPPLVEQERIVAKIEELLPLIKSYGESSERLNILNAEFPDKLRKSILQQAVQGKLTERDPSDEPASELLKRICAEKAKLIAEGKIKKEKPLPPITDEEKPFDIPDTWEWTPLRAIYNIHSSKRIHAKEYTIKGVPFFRSLEVVSLAKGIEPPVSYYISKARYDEICQDNIMPKKGDLLIACIGGSIGWNWVVDDRTFYYKDGNVVAFDGHDNFDIEYLRLYLSSPIFLKQIFDDVSGTAYKALTIEMLKAHYIPVPPLAEQKRIVARVEELLAVCDELK